MLKQEQEDLLKEQRKLEQAVSFSLFVSLHFICQDGINDYMYVLVTCRSCLYTLEYSEVIQCDSQRAPPYDTGMLSEVLN